MHAKEDVPFELYTLRSIFQYVCLYLIGSEMIFHESFLSFADSWYTSEPASRISLPDSCISLPDSCMGLSASRMRLSASRMLLSAFARIRVSHAWSSLSPADFLLIYWLLLSGKKYLT